MSFKCLECDKKLRKPVSTCPRCKGSDIDLDPEPNSRAPRKARKRRREFQGSWLMPVTKINGKA